MQEHTRGAEYKGSLRVLESAVDLHEELQVIQETAEDKPKGAGTPKCTTYLSIKIDLLKKIIYLFY